MKVSVFIIVMVTHLISCEKSVLKLQRKLVVPNLNEKCKQIKCASVNDPICVQMRRHDIGLTLHIVAANKCELEYMKCHDDVEAKIVPMKYCGHNAVLTAEKKKKEIGKAHIRIKRKADKLQLEKSIKVKPPTNAERYSKIKLSDVKKLRNAKLARLWKNKNWEELSKFNVLKSKELREQSVKEKHARQADEFSTEANSGENYDDPRSKYSPIPLPFTGKSRNEDTTMVTPHVILPGSEETPDFPMLSKESSNFSVDKEEYDEICPSVCPSRDVMVCARCQHGIFKSFISICHMRMFMCQHEDEVLELVSRFPCMLSAPYISEGAMKPKGRMVQPSDDDLILRFMICRARGLLPTKDGPGDPRCIFPKTKENLKYFDYKGTQVSLVHHLLNSEKESGDSGYFDSSVIANDVY